MKILVLCTGNSCRSQIAHGFLESFDTRLEVYSAGTKPADKVNPMAVCVMEEVGIDISRHIPTNVIQYINQDWDYVISVCDDANEDCPIFVGGVKKRLHIGFQDPSKAKGRVEFIHSEFVSVREQIRKRFFDFYKNEILKAL